jgi:hypothetical protein
MLEGKEQGRAYPEREEEEEEGEPPDLLNAAALATGLVSESYLGVVQWSAAV